MSDYLQNQLDHLKFLFWDDLIDEERKFFDYKAHKSLYGCFKIENERVKAFMIEIIDLNMQMALDEESYKKKLEEFIQGLKMLEKENSPQIIIKDEGRLPLKADMIISKSFNIEKKNIPDFFLENLRVEIKFYEDKCFDDLNDYIQLFLNSLCNHTLNLGFETSKFNLCESVHVSDEFGEWSYQPLQDLLKLELTTCTKSKIPSEINIPAEFFKNMKNVIKKKVLKSEEKISISEKKLPALNKFIAETIVFAKKSDGLQEVLMDSLKKTGVEYTHELLQWTDEDWNSSSIPVDLKRILKKEISKYRYNFENSKKEEETDSILLSKIHRVKRYLKFRATNYVDDMPYLNAEALEKGFHEISSRYCGDELLSDLKIFYYTFNLPADYSESLNFPQGMLLFGPPGTGKTVLTEVLPQRIGLTPIAPSLSSAEVNRGIVGQTEKLLLDLVSRARKIPYLLCCVAIDEIDGLAPKRDEKSSEHKNDALAILLAVIGGNKDVKNLMFVASTNRLNQMDDAFKRRMSGQFFVGRPSPKARYMMLKKATKLGLDDNMINKIVSLTTNFSGAALKQLISNIVVASKKMQDITSDFSLSYDEILSIACRTSRQFNIKLGSYVVPELFSIDHDGESLIEIEFMRKVYERKAILSFNSNDTWIIYPKFNEDTNEIEIKRRIILKKKIQDEFIEVTSKFEKIRQLRIHTSKKKQKIDYEQHFLFPDEENFKDQDISLIINTLREKIENFISIAKKNGNILHLIYIYDFDKIKQNHPDFESKRKEIKKFLTKIFSSKYEKNMYFIFLVQNYENSKLPGNQIYQDNWTKFETKYDDHQYTGRIFIDLSSEIQEMRLEIEPTESNENRAFFCDPLCLNKRAISTKEIIPKVIDFAATRQIDYVLLMDQDFLLSANAFDDSKIKENITEKMQEFKFYPKSLLIIDVDSIVGIASSISESSMGPSISYNLTDSKLYSLVTHYANTIPKIISGTGSEYWIVLITKNEKIAQMLQKDLYFPNTDAQNEMEEQERKKNEDQSCAICKSLYTETKNENNSCHYHDGIVIDIETMEEYHDYDSAKLNFLAKVMNSDRINDHSKKKEPKFIYLCCLNNVDSQGCKVNYHKNKDERVFYTEEYEEKLKILKEKRLNKN